MTTKQIIENNESEAATDALRDLVYRKWKAILPDAEFDEFHRYEEFTQVERDFLLVDYFETAAAMNGRSDYAERLQPYLETWGRVGMHKTAIALQALGTWGSIWKLYNDRVEDCITNDELLNLFSSQLLTLKADIEEAGEVLLEFNDFLPKYVAQNIDQFCKQDAEGNFI